MSSLTYGNELTGTIGYDNQYRVSGITATGVVNLSYPTYDNNGNIQAIQDQLDPTKNRSFTYDVLDRLGTAAGPWGSLGWTYDEVGNRQTENSNVYTYAPNTNKLASANGISFGYDNSGNTTSEAARVYTYNQNQRLIRVTDGAMTANYAFNGNGQRVKKNVNGTVTIFHYSLNGQIIAESNSAGTVTAEYVYLNGQPIAKMEGASTYYYHNDHLGTPQKITDSTGNVVWSADYKPFGEVTITVSTITNNLRFPGQYYDAETGLNYNYYRDYNPVIGKYIQADPLGLMAGANLYAYVGGSPINRTDPLGLIRCTKSWKADWEPWESPFTTRTEESLCFLPPDLPDLPSMPKGEKPKKKWPKLPGCFAKIWEWKLTFQKYVLIPYYREICYDDCPEREISDTGWVSVGAKEIETVLIKKELMQYTIRFIFKL
jgi:RHS repeat-associated protein